MILQALKEYYDRKSVDPDGGIAPEGFECKEIPFIIVLDEYGDFVQIEDTRYQNGKTIRAKSFFVPQAEKRTAGVKANLLWDNAEYIFGICIKSKPERVKEQHADFINRIRTLGADEDAGIKAILGFYTSNKIIEALQQSNHNNEIRESNPFMTFRLNGDTNLICERPAIVEKILSKPSNGIFGTCLISGEYQALANLQPAIKGVQNTNSTGGNIVSFNLAAFNSFGKTQGGNAPISDQCAFAYTTALNHLLRKDSPQKIQIGDATTIFWSEKKTHFENEFSLFLEAPVDNPDASTNKIKSLLTAIDNGILPIEDNSHFFVLGLSPNAARISVRFWYTEKIVTIKKRIFDYYKDLELVHSPNQHKYLSIRELLRSTALLGKSENIMPNLGGEWMRCILAGSPYPELLLQATLQRIRAERLVSYPRAAIIKACLNRKARFQNHSEKEITVSLDIENRNAGYRLGRLFAILEKIQEETHPGINATIRDRYYSSASCTPASVMPILMRLKNHHLAKLEKGRAIYFEQFLGETLDEISDFPSQLNLYDQGRFAIGYYHQRQAFFTKSAN